MMGMETLLTLAEVAIGMVGFSAIVVLFRRRAADTWRRADADRFHGMVIHAVHAAFFCILPAIVRDFVVDEASVWALCSGLLGVTTALHVARASTLSSNSLPARAALAGVGGLVVALLFLNALLLSESHGFGLYAIGVFWHVVQAGLLFVMLIFIPDEQIVED